MGERSLAAKRLIVCVTGMAGAGKSTAANAIAGIGFTLVNMGDVIREEATKRRLDPTDANVGSLMLELRRVNGARAVAELCIDKIETIEDRYVVVDGVRSLDEVETFRERGRVLLVAAHASPARRYEYLRSRGRPDAPRDWDDFRVRDGRELSVGVGATVALADEVVPNNRLSLDEFRHKAIEVVKQAMTEVEV